MKARGTIVGPFLGSVIFGWALAAAPAGAEPVEVLNAPANPIEATDPGATATASVPVGPFRTPALVLVAADGQSTYQGPQATSGIRVEIRETGPDFERTRAQDDSLEAQSLHVVYRAAASYNFYLPAGDRRVIGATTHPYGTGSAANKNTSVRLSVIVLAAR